MPCYLFTFHAYRSWMPDRPKGYVRRGQGVLPPNERIARQYRRRAKAEPAAFAEPIQRLVIDETLTACERQGYRAHFVATEPTHVHILVSWRTERAWQQVRTGLKSSLTRRLNRERSQREWFSESGSRKRVKDRPHFDYLIEEYLPSHRGWKWREGVGCFH